MKRHDWPRFLPALPSAYTPWMHDHGSLTLRIQQRSARFTVQPVRQGLAHIAYDESSLLNLPAHHHAYSREVYLYADAQPVVFAHSACASQHLRGIWRAMNGLGNRSLGSLLFTHPQVTRRPLHYLALRAPHPLYQRAASVLATAPDILYARRSLFQLHGAPLLVTEVFLPYILRLQE